MINIKSSFYIVLIICQIIQFFSCNENNHFNKNENLQILAKIGSETITVEEFRNNYELGFSNLKTGENKKKTYLEYMINEKLLMFEGYKIGLDESENVLKSIESLKQELLIELLIEEKVKDKIRVTEKEIKESINKSKVRFKFRYWYESTNEKAKAVTAAMNERGYAEVVEEILLNNPENKIDPKYFETDYLNYEQVSPDLLLAIKDLPYGDISDPVEINDKFYIFQVLDIRRTAITENEYKSEASSVEQVVFYRKFEKALVEYGKKLLDRKSIKTKRKAFNLLAEAILEWKNIDKKERLDFAESLSGSKQNLPALQKLSENLDETFLDYKEGHLSIQEFINYIDTSKFLKDFESKNEFIKYLHTKVAQSIRDIFLVREAISDKLEENQQLQQELLLWKNKWVYEELRNQIIKDISAPNNVQNNIKSTFANKIENLRNTHKIQIYESILDTIKVIDFKKSRWATMQIFKYGSNKPAYPVVDPRLGLLNN